MRNSRKWLVLLLALVMLVSNLSITAMAAEDESPIALRSAASGSTVQVQILATKTQTVADGKLVVTFDADALTCTRAEVGAAWGEGTPTWSVNRSTGKVILAFACEDTAAEGVLFTLTFDASADAVVAIDSSSYITGVSASLAQEITTCPSARFADMQGMVDVIHDAVDYMVANGYMNGMDTTHFGPDVDLNRAMMVTILYRIAGSPAVEGAPAFTDVPAGQFYTDAVVWSTANGVTNGIIQSLFAPGKQLTRQELVAFLYRFAGVMDYDRTATTELSAYANEVGLDTENTAATRLTMPIMGFYGDWSAPDVFDRAFMGSYSLYPTYIMATNSDLGYNPYFRNGRSGDEYNYLS